MTDKKSPYVGYGHPPKHTQFKKGQSGNLRGRPRQREHLQIVLQRVLKRKVTVKDAGGKMTIQEALIRSLRELAMQGDKQALALQRRILSEAGYDEPDPTLEMEKQQKLVDEAHAKFRELLRARGFGNDE